MKIGSHVSFSGKTPFTSAVKIANGYQANAMMIYTGAPQSTLRKDINLEDIKQGKILAHELNIPFDNIIVHAPYIINLGNPIKPQTRQFGVEFLIKEINRSNQIGTKIIVLHPGSHLKHSFKVGADYVILSLKRVFSKTENSIIALETMAGKGSELGRSFEELAYIVNGLSEYSDRVGICFDTCHVHDAGYDLVNNYEKVISEFNEIIGLDKLACIHINDSKNLCGARKDRHENIGYGYIGFNTFKKICEDMRFSHLVKILETPYFNKLPPYKIEIQMLKKGVFVDWKNN